MLSLTEDFGTGNSAPRPTLWAVSDIHVSHNKNKPLLDRIQPSTPQDWLIVAGDVAEKSDDIRSTLTALSRRFEKVIWVPGNHELWTTVRDPVQMFGASRYDYLVTMCRELGVVTPEDPFPVWEHDESGPVTLVPMFLLYDYSFLPEGATNQAEGLKIAYDANVVCSDEFLLKPDPYLSRDAWCRARVKYTRNRLEQIEPGTPVVLINHWPLVSAPTEILRYPEFALWCGTTETASWHTDFNTVCAVYGHLHIPRTTYYDGVRFEEVSLGYPTEWEFRGLPDKFLRQILPAPVYPPGSLNDFGGHFKISPEMRAKYEEKRARLEAAKQRRRLDPNAPRRVPPA